VLQTLQVVLSEFALLDGHAEHYAGLNQQAQLALGCAAFAVHPAQISCRTGLGTQLFCRSTRGHEFLTCGIRVWATDKLETCRHRGQHFPCRTGLGTQLFCRSTRGNEFLTCGIRVWATDKLETCRHGGTARAATG